MAKRPRGRPREFDEAVVLDRALDAFWDNGYEATSLDDLAAATGLARASIYAAFGDKESFYLRTLDRFVERMRKLFGDSSVETVGLVRAVTDFFQGAIALYFSGDRPRGCLVICTSASPAASHPEIRRALAATLKAIENAFACVFTDAEKRGLIPPDIPPSLRAQFSAAILHSIALRARAGESRHQLENFAQRAAALLCAESETRLLFGKRRRAARSPRRHHLKSQTPAPPRRL